MVCLRPRAAIYRELKLVWNMGLKKCGSFARLAASVAALLTLCVLPQSYLLRSGHMIRDEGPPKRLIKGTLNEVEAYMIVNGHGDRVAKAGDQVRVKYQLYRSTGKVKEEKGPEELTLGGQHIYGRGFDDKIRGMKVEETRELHIPPQLCPCHISNKWKGLKNFAGIGSEQKKKFVVTLLAILD